MESEGRKIDAKCASAALPPGESEVWTRKAPAPGGLRRLLLSHPVLFLREKRGSRAAACHSARLPLSLPLGLPVGRPAGRPAGPPACLLRVRVR